VSQPTLPPDRPRWAVLTVRAIQAVLAALALAAVGWTAVARPAPEQDRAPARPGVTTVAPAGYTPRPAGPPRTVAEPQGASR
jgi:hypothetical protein